MNRHSRIVERLSAGALAFTLAMLPVSVRADEQSDRDERSSASEVRSGEPPAEARPQRGIEEITVTARKFAEPLQESPIAITAFDEAALKDLDIRGITDVTASTPNLQIDRAVGQASSSRVYLRGVGNGDAIASDDPGVGIYIDGVYLPRAQGSLLAVSDIAQVEVLRGPQGTLFGKNNIGGAVNVTTQKPSFELGGNAELRLGYENQIESRGSINVPLMPEVAAMRISFATATNDGYTKNRFLDNRTSDEKMLAGRVQLLLAPTAESEWILSADHSRENRSATSAKCKVPITNRAAGTTGVLAGGLFRFIAPEVQTGCEIDDFRADDEVFQDGKAEDGVRTYGTALRGTVDFTDTITFKTTSSWRRNKTSRFFDADGTQFNIAQDQRELGGDKAKQDAFSQEFNLTGLSMSNRLKWTTGAYWFYESNQSDESAQALAIAEEMGPFTNADLGSPELNRDSALRAIANAATGLLAAGVPIQGGRLISQANAPAGTRRTFNGVGDCIPGTASADGRTCLALFRSVPTRGFFKTNQTSYAGYGELTYDVTDALSFTAGLRFTHERKRVAEQSVAVRGEGAFGAGRINEPAAGSTVDQIFTDNYELSDRYDKWTPRAIVKYRFNDDLNVYASWSRGFKSGTFSRPSDGLVPPSVKPEVLTAYEVGVKSQFFDNRLTANLATYLSYYEEIQLTRVASNPDGTLRVQTENAGEARIWGGELEMRALPLPGLELGTQIGVTAARYVENATANPDAKLPGTPALTMSYSAAYTVPFFGLGDLRSTVRWFHEGKKGSDILDPHFTRVNKHGLLSARFSLELNDGKTEIALVGRNLLDREYFANSIDLTGSVGTSLRYYAPRRNLAIELRRQF
jgi:iron complex outermembrane recepter protein